MIQRTLAFSMAMAVLVVSACGTLRHPATAGLSVEGQAAVAGRQLVAAISAAADGTDVLIDSQVLTRTQGVAVLQVLRGIGVESQRLAEALDVIRVARVDTVARETAILKASDIIKGMQAAILRGIVPGGSEASRARLAALFGAVANALVDIGLVLHRNDTAELPDSWIPGFTEAMNFKIQNLDLEGVR